MEPKIVGRQEWLQQRRELLEQEKKLTQLRDELSQARRELPWVRVDKAYEFETTRGNESLGQLFGEHRQLLLYHFMFGPEWQEGCPSCSFWADNYSGTEAHLAARDIQLVVVSRAPLDRLQAYRERMGWTFDWVSSLDSDFNFDFAVSFTPEELESEKPAYNFDTMPAGTEEAPGLSVFCQDEDGEVFHTYSCYARGLDIFNGAYHHIDVTPRGRNEDDLPWPMAWIRRHDQYNAQSNKG